MYGIFLRTRRRWDEAIAEMKQALALNPVSAETTKALGATYFGVGRPDLAIEQYERALALDPTHAQTHDLLADAYAASGQYARALESRRRYLTLEGADDAADALGSDPSEAGYRKAMGALYRRYLARLEEDARNPRDYISLMEFAFIYIGSATRSAPWPRSKRRSASERPGCRVSRRIPRSSPSGPIPDLPASCRGSACRCALHDPVPLTKIAADSQKSLETCSGRA